MLLDGKLWMKLSFGDETVLDEIVLDWCGVICFCFHERIPWTVPSLHQRSLHLALTFYNHPCQGNQAFVSVKRRVKKVQAVFAQPRVVSVLSRCKEFGLDRWLPPRVWCARHFSGSLTHFLCLDCFLCVLVPQFQCFPFEGAWAISMAIGRYFRRYHNYWFDCSVGS